MILSQYIDIDIYMLKQLVTIVQLLLFKFNYVVQHMNANIKSYKNKI